VVIKPASAAPGVVFAVAEALDEAGLPDGVLNVVTGPGSSVGNEFVTNEGTDAVSFTGSGQVGQMVYDQATDAGKRVQTEMGGKNPTVVADSADPAEAAEIVATGGFGTTGQSCTACSRAVVHEDVYDEFVEDLAERTEALDVGPGSEDPDVGPLISPDARRRVADSVEAAIEDGARVLAGGEIPREGGNYYAPTVIEGVGDDHDVSRTELFGPVLSVYSFADEREAIERANDTDYGLYGAIWTERLDRAHRVAADLEAGSVTVNEYPATFPQAPFGGYKQSGIGREKGRQAITEYTELKNVSIALGDTPGAVFEK